MKIYGPYERKDKRKHIVIVHEDGQKQTKSYPKFLMEQHLGRELEDWETVDHINNDFTDDRIENLQILSREENARKESPLRPKLEIKTFACPECKISFNKRMHRVRYNQGKRQNAGPFCSRKCSGTWTRRIQLNGGLLE